MTPTSETLPDHLCRCGCGKKSVSTYLQGHNKRVRPALEDAQPFKIDGVYCRLIPLTRGQYAIVWESDYAWLMQWKWMATWAANTKSWYAVRSGLRSEFKGNRPLVRMHAQILGSKWADHQNHVTLDNRRANLRAGTRAGGVHNRRRFANNTSGYKGVSWHNGVQRWQARIGIGWKRISLGYFDTPEGAYAAYCEAALKLHGEFACLS